MRRLNYSICNLISNNVSASDIASKAHRAVKAALKIFTLRESFGLVTLVPPFVGRQMPVTVNEMLLRGCTLRNTGHILGLVVYTGVDSRIQMNAAKTPNKVGGNTNDL